MSRWRPAVALGVAAAVVCVLATPRANDHCVEYATGRECEPAFYALVAASILSALVVAGLLAYVMVSLARRRSG